jgi:hypothetical protein
VPSTKPFADGATPHPLRTESFAEVAERLVRKYRAQLPDRPTPLSKARTGFPTLDRIIGLDGACVLSGEPDDAVLAVAINCARATALNKGRVLWIGQGGNFELIAKTILASRSWGQLKAEFFERGLRDYQIYRLAEVAGDTAWLPIDFIDVNDASLERVRATCLDLARSRPLDLLVMDCVGECDAASLREVECLSEDLGVTILMPVPAERVRDGAGEPRWEPGALPLRPGTPEIRLRPEGPAESASQMMRIEVHAAGEGLRKAIPAVFFEGLVIAERYQAPGASEA